MLVANLLPLLAFLLPCLSAPTQTLAERGASQCGQYSSIATGAYTIYTNEWGSSYATSGSQCSQINSLSGNTLAWSTSWSWAGAPTQVKSYTNTETSFTSKPLSQFKSIPTTWNWSYTGTNISANVAFDTFLGNSAGGSQTYEIMVWLGEFGNISPLSSNGYPPTPIATPTIDGVAFNLILGKNGAVTVYSFVAASKKAQTWSGDLMGFYNYLETQYKLSSALYLLSIQAGSEVFTGSNAVLTTSAYSITVS